MSNCDIEELKHIALQKFIELADEDCWDVGRSWGSFKYEFGQYVAEHEYSFGSNTYMVSLNGEKIFCAYYPRCRDVKQTAAGRPNKIDAAKAQKEFEEAVKEFEATPAIIAYRKISKRQEDKDCQKREEAMKKAMEESCKRLQEVLAGDPTEETVVQKVARARERMKNLSIPMDAIKAYSQPKRWWEVWK